MVDFLLGFLGVTFIYAGVLMIPMYTEAISCALVGVVLLLRPAGRLLQAQKPLSSGHAEAKKMQERRRNLRIVRTDSDKDKPPTYH